MTLLPGRCVSCRWWAPPTLNSWDSPEPQHDRGGCGRAVSRDGKPEDAASLAVAQDSEEYSAWLETAPLFGCVQYVEAGGAPA